MSTIQTHRGKSVAVRAKSAGFTLIEVMIAVAIMTVGAMGIMALQQAATRGNMEARQMTMATQLTRVWIERVRTDALRWNNKSVPTGLASTDYLMRLPPATGSSGWFTPAPPAASGDQYAFDYFGRDTSTTGQRYYCTHLRLTWLAFGDSARVEARTFWRRRGNGTDSTLSNAALFPNCGAGGSEASVTDELSAVASRLRSVTAATVVRWQPIR